jgi:hypothetical protein
MKIRLLGAELLHADGRKDGRTDRQTERHIGMTKLIVAFRSFANTPTSQTQICALWACSIILMGFVIIRRKCNGRSDSFGIVTLSAAYEFRCSFSREPT